MGVLELVKNQNFHSMINFEISFHPELEQKVKISKFPAKQKFQNNFALELSKQPYQNMVSIKVKTLNFDFSINVEIEVETKPSDIAEKKCFDHWKLQWNWYVLAKRFVCQISIFQLKALPSENVQ